VRKRGRERREEGGQEGMKAVGRERHVRLLLREADACAYSKDVVSAQTFLSVSASRRREQRRWDLGDKLSCLPTKGQRLLCDVRQRLLDAVQRLLWLLLRLHFMFQGLGEW